MKLSEAVTRAQRLEASALPALNRIASKSAHILARWPDAVGNPPERDRERLVREMRERVEQSRWDGLKMSFVTAAGRALFDELRRERDDLAALRAFYCREIEASTRSSFLSALFTIYLESFVPGAGHTRSLARALATVRSRIGGRWRAMLERVPQCLDPDRAPEAVATLMLDMEDPWSELKKVGIRSPHAPGLMDYAHLAYVRKLAPTLRNRAGLDRLFSWLKPERQSAKATGASEAISAVLSHWRSSDPPQEDIRTITETLIGFYGDPRVSSGGAWAGVPQDLAAVIMRWLTGENIRFFLDVVSAVEDSHMWEPRRKFWLKLYEQGRIDSAWVAFSRSGADYARRLLANRGSRGILAYGIQTAGGSRSNTSLLVLKIGNRIVVEGSHDYRVHIFRETNPSAPRLYQEKYDCEAIRLTVGADARRHIGDWQSWVLERI
jgi:hypothetical protein